MATKRKLKLAAALGVASEREEPTEASLAEAPPSVEGLIDDVLTRRTEKLHFFRPSMLGGCDRANVFHYMNAPFHPQRQNPRLLRILDTGSATHELVQGYLGDLHEWWFVKEARILVHVGNALVRGSCDGVLIRRRDLYRFGLEIKTINHEDFIKLTKAKPQHVFQALLYCHLQKLPWIVIVYWDKDKQHIKEYPIRAEKSAWLETKARVKELYGYVERRELPEYDESTCDTSFCQFVDFCRKKGAPV